MKAYKGFNKDMTCRGFQYEEGRTYETDEAKLCESGFHACLMPFDCFNYYPINDSVFHEVELDGVSDEREDDTKVCSKKIKVGGRLSIAGIVKAQIDFVFEKSSKEDSDTSRGLSSVSTSGNRSSAAASGYSSSAATSGYHSSAATSGDGSSAATSGNYSSAATSGYHSSAATYGKASIAVSNGVCARGKGVIGSYIVLTEYSDGNMTAKMERVDGERIKADTWYILKNGEFKEWEESDWD